MCTLTLSLQHDRSIITSNRDVHRDRPPAEPPTWHNYRGRDLFFPRDGLAGGSWIAHTRDRQVGILLNGAFENHRRAASYRMSRGHVLLELMASEDVRREMEVIDLIGIEPFTFVFLERYPTELRWDGAKRYFRSYPEQGNWIWSSSTLFDRGTRLRRRHRFEEYLSGLPQPDPDRLWDLHGQHRIERHEGYVLNRACGIQTVARVQWVLEQDRIDHRYL